jgi:hypothetical protein|tara:strand:- start:51 stop:419 length:369 start_codon:yes stop_codon:yes gene_type:complete
MEQLHRAVHGKLKVHRVAALYVRADNTFLYPICKPRSTPGSFAHLSLSQHTSEDAVDANEVKVGTWEIPYQAPPQFWTPPDTGCGGISLMHADAQPKSYKHHFSFRAPAAATGKVRKVSLSL